MFCPPIESPGLASSRVNPLPQGPHRFPALWKTCGSGFTRERAGPGIAVLTGARMFKTIEAHVRKQVAPAALRAEFRQHEF
ncbi:diguanylate cyclase [Pseudomonas putida]|nr:diguanylate cyclase [Pseudomonas putida]